MSEWEDMLEVSRAAFPASGEDPTMTGKTIECGAERSRRILHLSVHRMLSSGQRKQLVYEVKAARRIPGVAWDTLVFHNGKHIESFERPIPWPFRSAMLRSLYVWITALRLRKQYEFILIRHMPFDPFCFLFASLLPNRVSVHHSKEVEELPLIRPGRAGHAAAWLERHTGRFVVRRGAGILGVTSEISAYERDTRGSSKPIGVYPNGINPDAISLAGDRRHDSIVNAVFICGTFSDWHGLDRLIDAISRSAESTSDLRVHLIGSLNERQLQHVARLGDLGEVVKVHGFLDQAQYQELMDCSDIGIGSLAMDRQNLREGATLKVRELLAAGLPVYSGHDDTALPAKFPYYLNGSPIGIEGLMEFAKRMKAVSRAEVREAALLYISKQGAVEGVVAWLDRVHAAGKVKPGPQR